MTLGSSESARLHSHAVHSFTQVCWRQHNATLSHSKCFWIGICSLSHKMERRGGLGIWKGHIWRPPRWVFTFKDKWSHWDSARCEWAPSAHTGFLNAHQNNLSKPRDAFLRCLMWGQIGNHFNKIPLRLNCISQKAKPAWGETLGTVTAEPLPAGLKVSLREGIYCADRFTADVQAAGMRRYKTSIEATLKPAVGWMQRCGRASPPQSRIHPWNLCENRAKEEEKPPGYFYTPSLWGWKDNNIPNPVKAILF